MLRCTLIAASVACALVFNATAQQTFTFGRDVAAAPLAQFRLGVTTMADVRAALGEPRGDGVTRHNPREAQRVIWFYEYGQIRPDSGGDTETSLKIILVFFKGDRYDGHLWFADKKIVPTQLLGVRNE